MEAGVGGRNATRWEGCEGKAKRVAAGRAFDNHPHGLFDTGAFWHAIVNHVRREKGLDESEAAPLTMEEFREREFDRLADVVRRNLDMEALYAILRGGEAKLGKWKQA